MKRALLSTLKYTLAFLVILYCGDWLIWQIRAERQAGMGSVQVDQFLGTPLKGQKEEYDFLGTTAEPCARSIFPHASSSPCWWLEQHKTQWESR